MAYSRRRAGERWPEIPPDRDEEPSRDRGRAGQRGDLGEYADDPFFYEERPVVNPYSIVALVAALILLFPVAIVFGLIAFGHPRGRFMAFAALVLGVLEVALLAAFVLLPRETAEDVFAGFGDAVGDMTGTQVPDDPVTISPPTSDSASPTGTPATAAPSASVSGSATVPAAELDTACPEPALVGAAADGGTLLCLTEVDSVTGYQWSGPYRVGEAVREEGGSCTGGTNVTARTSGGYALVCENGAWVLWSS
ncbi:DUF4190 domain-containing protein [Nocardia sp. NBC_00416]|uniref:DUF4190 domain-containing protein n=1 Tax=Nocardia sp. NBC_00416 TaxID=2975991 RepID=UPI002E24477D